MKKYRIYINHQYMTVDQKRLHEMIPGVFRAKGVFETMLARDGKVVALDDHLKRLQRGLKYYQMSLHLSKDKLASTIKHLIHSNKIRSARVRLTVWKEKQRSCSSIVCLESQRPSTNKHQKGYKAMLSSIIQNKTSVSHLKTLNYGHFRKASLEAKTNGYDEAILLNKQKYIVEGSASNVFFVRKGILCTPSIESGCLNGITRQLILKSASQLGIKCLKSQFTLRELIGSDEAFLSNSLIEIMPLMSVNGQNIGQNVNKKMTEQIIRAYNELIKKY